MSTEPRFGFYCTCGGAMHGRVEPTSNAEELERIFRSVHDGPGHEPTDQRTAAKARRRAEEHRR